MARNSHRSAYHGAGLQNLKLWYLYPRCADDSLWINGRILSTDVENSLQEHSKIEAVFITSPTYEGICTDVKAVAKVCHNHGVPLIVDQAHGAHFPFSEYFPEDALKAGADVVIQSVHKTLPALTQTALLHIQGKLIDREKLHYYLSVYQSSSPSYVLMASIDSCMEQLEAQGDALYEAYIRRLKRFRSSCEDLRHLKLLGKESFKKAAIYDFDNSRLVISVEDAHITGEALMHKLRIQYHLEMEMATKGYVVGISTVADQEEDLQRLSSALHTLDATFNGEQDGAKKVIGQKLLKVDMAMPLRMAIEQEKEWVEISKAEDRIAGKYLYLYPPGIPLVVSGERLTEELCNQIKYCLEAGLEIQGLDKSGRINVVK